MARGGWRNVQPLARDLDPSLTFSLYLLLQGTVQILEDYILRQKLCVYALCLILKYCKDVQVGIFYVFVCNSSENRKKNTTAEQKYQKYWLESVFLGDFAKKVKRCFCFLTSSGISLSICMKGGSSSGNHNCVAAGRL